MSTKVFERRLTRSVSPQVHFQERSDGQQKYLNVLWKSRRLAWVSESLARTLYISSMAQQWLTLDQAKLAQQDIMKYARTPLSER